MSNRFLLGAAVKQSSLSAYQQNLKTPFKDTIKAGGEQFAIALTANGQLMPGSTSFSSQAAATEHLNRHLSQFPAQAGALHVLSSFEVAA